MGYLAAKKLLMKLRVPVDFLRGIRQIIGSQSRCRGHILICQYLRIRGVENIVFIVYRADGDRVTALCKKSCNCVMFFLGIASVVFREAEISRSSAEHLGNQCF